MVAINTEVEALIEQVKRWSVDARIALARRVLETLETSAAPSPSRKRPLAEDVLGLWSPSGTVPSDAECDQILVEELQRKYSP